MYQQSCCTCRRCLDTALRWRILEACNYCGGELHGIQCAQGDSRVSLHQTFRLRAEIVVYGQHAQIAKPLVRLEQVEHTFFYSQSALFGSRIVRLWHKCCHAPWRRLAGSYWDLSAIFGASWLMGSLWRIFASENLGGRFQPNDGRRRLHLVQPYFCAPKIGRGVGYHRQMHAANPTVDTRFR